MRVNVRTTTTEEKLTAMLQLATTVVCPHQLKTSNRHTSCPGSRAGTPVCQRENPAVVVVRSSWCRAGGFIRKAVGGVCAVGQSCAVCVLVLWLQVGLSQARTTSKPHLSSEINNKVSRKWEFPPTRYFGLCGPRITKISQQPGVVKNSRRI